MARCAKHSATDKPTAPSRGAEIARPTSGERLLSLDVLRGFTMFWIIGGSDLLLALVRCSTSSPAMIKAFKVQLDHPDWEGFVFWDAIMPVFLFVVGAAMPFAFAKRAEKGVSLTVTYGRIARRVAVLWLCGILIQQLRYHYDEWPGFFTRPELYSNTLQAIAVGYLVTAVALLHFSIRGQIALFFTLLLGYWACLTFIPFNPYPAGHFEETANFALFIDNSIFGDFRRDHCFTWALTSLGFAASVLMGALAGHLFRGRLSVPQKLLALVSLGIACMAAGWTWSYWLPLNRHVWTSSMILWAGGWSFLAVALFYAVVDVAKIRWWTFPFIVIGVNALLAYMLDAAIDRYCLKAAKILVHQPSGLLVDVLNPTIELTAIWLLLWWLYRRRIFFRA